jgi:cell division protein FtsW (lipid II flippase)
MIRQLQNLDRGFLLVVFIIAALGLYNLASAGQPLGASLHLTHAVHLSVGLAAAALLASLHYRYLEGLAFPILGATLALLLLTMGFGRVVNGSRRWLPLGVFTLQTSDFAKLAVILVVARAFHLQSWDGTLRLRDIFRPLNPSRPLLMLALVTSVAWAGDSLSTPRLEKTVGGRAQRVASLSAKSSVLRIGRSRRNEVRVPYSGVDQEHAQVVRLTDGRYQLTDLGSEAGTFVNEVKVEGRTPLRHGDVLRFGTSPQAELRFSARLQPLKPWMPWLAVGVLIWLGFAILNFFRERFPLRELIAPIDWVLLPCVLILIQPDLGTTVVVLLIAFSMILFVGLRPSSLLALIGGSAAFGVLAWSLVLQPYQKARVVNFLDPDSDLAGAGYHQNQSLIAVGSGEVWGKGHAQGTQTQLSFLPEQQTDFIFSVWAEEQGFVGCVTVVALFAALFLLLLRMALRARDRFGCLLIVGVTAMLFWHSIINMLMVLRLAPVVGVPLPLWSQGGSFVMTAMLGLGLVASVDMRRKMF